MKNKKKSLVTLTDVQRDFIEQLINENKTHIYNIIRSVLIGKYRYLFEDCISELYLLMCTKAAILEKHPCPEAWVIVAARMTALSMIKKHKRDASNVPIDDADEVGPDETYEEALYSIWFNEGALIGNLTKRERQIYQKLYIEKKDVKRVARELNLNVSTVRSFKKLIKDKVTENIKNNV